MKPTKHNRPHNRLTRIADEALVASKESKEAREEDRIIVLMYDSDDTAAIALHGYDEDNDGVRAAAVDMLAHLQALFATSGVQISFMPLEERGRG